MGIGSFFNDLASDVGGLFSGSQGGNNLYGSLLGGGLSYLGARETGQSAREAAQMQANALTQNANAAMAQAQPWSVGGLGGTAQFDEGSRSIMQNLSPQLSNIYQGGLDRSGIFGGQATALSADPFAAQEQFYNQQQEFYQPEEDQLRTDLETRQLAQGRLGSTGGARQFGQLEQAIGQGQTQRRNAAFGQAQGLIDSLLGRESGDIGQSVGLLNIPQGMASQGMGLGASLGNQASAGLASRASGAQALGQAFAPSSMGTALSGIGGMFSNPYQPPQTKKQTPYSSYMLSGGNASI